MTRTNKKSSGFTQKCHLRLLLSTFYLPSPVSLSPSTQLRVNICLMSLNFERFISSQLLIQAKSQLIFWCSLSHHQKNLQYKTQTSNSQEYWQLGSKVSTLTIKYCVTSFPTLRCCPLSCFSVCVRDKDSLWQHGRMYHSALGIFT